VHPRTPTRLSRRSVLLGSAGLAFLAACGDDGSAGHDAHAPDIDLERLDDGTGVLFANFNSQGRYVRTGIPQRLTFAIAGADGIRTADVPESLDFRLSLDGEQVGEPIRVAAHGDGLTAPYFPLTATFDRPGFWTASVDLDGKPTDQVFTVDVPEDVPVLQVDQPMPYVETPTVDNPHGVEPICTADPECPLHERTLTSALTSGRPTALLVSTPQFCRTGLCGPVLELLVEQAQDGIYPAIQFIHAEVYSDAVAQGTPANATPAPIVDELGLDFEPSLFVVSSNGMILARLDNVYDRTELGAALTLAS
jgi:hypothetical protein